MPDLAVTLTRPDQAQRRARAVGVVGVGLAAADARDAGWAVLGVPGGGHAAGAGHVAVGVVAKAERAGRGDGVRVGGAVALGAHAGFKDDVADLVVGVELLARLRAAVVIQNGHGRGCRAERRVARAAQRQVNRLAALDCDIGLDVAAA